MARTRAKVTGKAAKGAAKTLRRSPAARKAAARAGKGALKTSKAGAKGAARAGRPRPSGGRRFLRYGLLALGALGVGALISRARSGGSDSSSYADGTGQHSPDASSPAGQRGETWGSGTPTGTSGAAGAAGATDIGTVPSEHQSPGDENRTGAEREYSDPSSGPLIGRQHRGSVAGVGEQQEEVEQRIRTRLGEDPRTSDMPRPNVEVNDGVAELRGPAPSEEAKQAAAEIAAETEGVIEVRNLIIVTIE